MLMPKKIKYRKVQRGTRKGFLKVHEMLLLANMVFRLLEPVWLTAQQIEAMRVTISRKIKKSRKILFTCFS